MDNPSFVDHLFSFQNPAFYGLLVVVALIIILLFLRKGFIKPRINRESEIENENLKLMALFAEIDPDPILRINDNGEIIGANNTAVLTFKDINLIGSKFSDLIPNSELRDLNFLNDKVISIADRYFSMSIRRISSLNFHQVYLYYLFFYSNIQKKS